MRAIDEVDVTQPVSAPHDLPAAPRPMRAMAAVVGAVIAAVMLLGTLALWGHYGTAVFFEMITSGFAACF